MFRITIAMVMMDLRAFKTRPYTPEAAAVRAGLRSGKQLVLKDTVQCPPLTPQDCSGIWLAWGECEISTRHQIMRWTIEVPALDGGSQCSDADGAVKQVPC